MAKASDWAGKVMGLLQSGNTAAAVGQIKVAPTVKDLKALQSAIIVGRCKGRWRRGNGRRDFHPQRLARVVLQRREPSRRAVVQEGEHGGPIIFGNARCI